MGETSRIEYKRELNNQVDIEKEVIAFLNSHEGGTILIGLNKDGSAFGVKDSDGDILKIKDRIKTNILPSAMGLFDFNTERIDGVDIIKLTVASGNEKPYYKKQYGMTGKGCYIRLGTAAEPMPLAMIEKLFANRTRNSIGKMRSHRQDLTFEQLRIYYDEKGKTLNDQFPKSLELLTEDDKFNYAAYLLADENNVSIKVAKYSGLDRVDLIENNEYGYCSLVKATKSVLDKIELENRTTTKITSKERKDKRLWDAIALREATINSIIHNMFTRKISPKFEIFADRIEITSAGTLPDDLTKDEFFEGISIPRNRELMRVFRDLELIEQLGSGVPRILRNYGRGCFYFMDNFTRMSFPASEKVGLVDGLVDRLADSQVKIIKLIKLKPKISKKEMAYNIGISTTAIDKHIRSLREANIIRRIVEVIRMLLDCGGGQLNGQNSTVRSNISLTEIKDGFLSRNHILNTSLLQVGRAPVWLTSVLLSII